MGMFDEILKGYPRCACGRSHKVDLKEIIMESGAIKKLPEVISHYKNGKVAMICDENTYKAAGAACEKIYKFDSVVTLSPENLHANEKSVEIVTNALKDDITLLVATGAGTIHDVTRYVAYKTGRQFISVPTAPSVDGYASGVAAMTFNGIKVTLTAVPPLAIVADTDILMNAPHRLVASGFGDLIGKYTSLLDWKVGHMLTGEPICDKMISLEDESLAKIMSNMEGVKNHEQKAIEDLFYGLTLSGLAIQMHGNSRPASGSEHHISHFIEMHVVNEENDAYHGEKVGIGFALVCKKYKELLNIDNIENRLAKSYAYPKAELAKVFGSLADEIDNENKADCLEKVKLTDVSEGFDKIKELIKALPTYEEALDIMRAVGAPATLGDIGLDSSLEEKLYRYSPYVRNRLTVMRLMRVID